MNLHDTETLELTRRTFLPGGSLRVLLIGESPPPVRGFFYFGDSSLFRATRPVLCKKLELPHDRDAFLAGFRAAGWFLDDLSTLRGDKPHLRPESIDVLASIDRLADIVESMSPEVVVGVLREIEALVRAVVQRPDGRETPWRCLRFPYHKDPDAVATYQQELSDVISEFRLDRPRRRP